MYKPKKVNIKKLLSNKLVKIRKTFVEENSISSEDVEYLLMLGQLATDFVETTEAIYRNQAEVPKETCPFINKILDETEYASKALNRLIRWVPTKGGRRRGLNASYGYAFETYSVSDLYAILDAIQYHIGDYKGDLEYVRSANSALRTLGALWSAHAKFFAKLFSKFLDIEGNKKLKLAKSSTGVILEDNGIDCTDWNVYLEADSNYGPAPENEIATRILHQTLESEEKGEDLNE